MDFCYNKIVFVIEDFNLQFEIAFFYRRIRSLITKLNLSLIKAEESEKTISDRWAPKYGWDGRR